jgi:hypothetical protein
VLALATAALLGGAFLLGHWRGAARAASQSATPRFTKLTFQRGTVWSARFSPDGQTVVYSARWEPGPLQLFSTRVDSIDARPVGLSDADVLSVSSSAEMAVSVGWTSGTPFSGIGTLARVPLTGGVPREIVAEVSAADWAPDGKSLAVARQRGLEFPVGRVLYGTPTAEWFVLRDVRVSPRGDRVAFFEDVSTNDSLLAVVDLSGRKQVLSTGWYRSRGLAWSLSGDEVWFTGSRTDDARAIHAVDLQGRERLVARVPGGADAPRHRSGRARPARPRGPETRAVRSGAGRGQGARPVLARLLVCKRRVG